MASRRPTYRLSSRLAVYIVGAGLLTLVIALLIVGVVQKRALTRSIGHQFETLANITSARLTHIMDQTFGEATLLALDPVIRDAVVDANRQYEGKSPDEIQADIERFKTQWDAKTMPADYRRRYETTAAAQFLRRYIERPLVATRYYTILVADKQGQLVASPFQPEELDFRQQAWWQSTVQQQSGGFYISDVALTPATAEFDKTYSIQFSVPIIGPEERVAIGALVVVSQVNHMFAAVTGTRIGLTDHTMLASSDGTLLFCPIFGLRNHTLKQSLIDEITRTNEKGWTVTTFDVHYSGKESINGFAPVATTAGLSPNSFGGQQWYIFTSQNPAETYQPMNQLLKWVGLTGLGGLALLGVVATFFARRFTAPIQELQRGAKLIGFGNLDYRLSIPTGDEIEELSDEFNEMASKLKSAYTGLEQRVAQRTRELEDRNRQLSILYAISSSLSAATELQGLLTTVLATTTQQLGAQITLIHLAGHSTPMYTSDHDLPLDSHQLEQAAIRACQESMQPPAQAIRLKQVIFDQETGDPNGNQPGPAASKSSSDGRRGNRSAYIFLTIPLVSKNRVVGAMTMLYPDGGGVRVEHDRYLLLTLGHQVGAAIEAAQLFEQTKKLDQLKSEFVSKVSHELRTPLTSIKGFGEILGSYDDIDATTRREFIHIINEESDRLTRLINDLLDLSKIEAGKVEWLIQPIDIGQILRYTVKQMQAVAMKKPVELKLELPPKLPLVLGDRDQLVQVMENLLSNAVKFTPEGVITVGAQWDPDQRQLPREETSVKTSDNDVPFLTIYVQDSGMGIPAQELSSIFEKFHQVTDNQLNRPKGTGLGLALCREIIDHLHGTIWCESTLGQGSRFSFTLPAVTPVILRSTAEPSSSSRVSVTTSSHKRET